MKRAALFILMLAVTILVSFKGHVSAQGLTTNENSAFADHLFVQHDYYRAITEYKRLLFSEYDPEQKPWLKYNIAMCYLLGGKLETAETLFRDLKNDCPNHTAGDQAILMLAETYYRKAEYRLAIDVLREFITSHKNNSCADAAKIMLGVCCLRLGNTHSAVETLGDVSSNTRYKQRIQALIEESVVYESIPQKNPWLAAGLSAVVPGAGQLYIHRPRDAMLSFLLNGALIVAAIAAFDRDEIVTGSLISFVEVGWYFGNIYNATSGAQKYNRRKKENFFYNLELQYGLNLFSRDKTSLCPSLAVKLDF